MVDYLLKPVVLDLTRYEIGNAVWREYKRVALKGWRRVIESWSGNLGGVLKLSISEEELKDVERIAVERGLSPYTPQLAFQLELKCYCIHF